MTGPAPLPGLLRPARHRLSELVGDLRQLASVQRIALRDGPDRGLPLLAFSTGGGLDFQIKENGTLDIRSLHFRGRPVGWQHPAGEPGNRERALTGFLVTCGLENVRAPRAGLAQHGSLAMSPVRVTGVGEDWAAAQPQLFVEGEIVQPQPNGAVFRLHRRITAPIGAARLTISDRIENISATAAEMMILYHLNFGFPVVQPGCTVALGARRIVEIADSEITSAPSAPECHPVDPAAQVRLIRPASADWPGLDIRLEFDGASLPYLQTWRDARAGRNILALEPCNCALLADGTSGPGPTLRPGAHWHGQLSMTFA